MTISRAAALPKRSLYNLASPNGIVEPCRLSDLLGWLARELTQVPENEKSVLKRVADQIDSFVRWPRQAILLWPDCDRIAPPGKKHRYHSYPTHIRQLAKTAGVVLDTRPNGPAIASFRLAGGERPDRFGSSNRWSIHHLYSGKFPYCGLQVTTHAAQSGRHFTQSAGLIAAHPIADALADEYPFFAWLLRARAFNLFGYDPDGVFSRRQDSYGFASGRSCRIISGSSPVHADTLSETSLSAKALPGCDGASQGSAGKSAIGRVRPDR